MEIKEEKIEKIIYEVKKTYVANDGTEFKDLEECEEYEETAKCVINVMFNKLNIQCTESFAEREDIFTAFPCYDDMYAVKVESLEQLEIINKWIYSKDKYADLISQDKIGTIQLIDVSECGVWVVGTPEKMKERFAKSIDKLYNELLEKKGEKA